MSAVHAVAIADLLGNVGTIAAIASALVLALIAMIVLAQGQEARQLRQVAEDEAERARQAEAALAAHRAAAGPVVRAQAVAKPAVPLQVATNTDQGSVAVATPEPHHSGSASPALGSATPSPLVAAAVAAAARPLAEPASAGPAEMTSQPTGAHGQIPERPAPVVIPQPGARSVPVASPMPAQAPPAALGAPSTAAASAGTGGRQPRPPAKSRKRRSFVPALLATAVVLAAGAFLIFQTGSSDKPAQPPAVKTGSSGKGAVVAVLNGTPISGLASQVARTLTGDGFKRGLVTNAPDQQRATTLVSYLPGHRADAEAVAARLGIKAPVQPVDDNTLSIACPPTGTCTAEVVVTVGSDRTR